MAESDGNEGPSTPTELTARWWQHSSQMSQSVDEDMNQINPTDEFERTEATSLSQHNKTTPFMPRLPLSVGAKPVDATGQGFVTQLH